MLLTWKGNNLELESEKIAVYNIWKTFLCENGLKLFCVPLLSEWKLEVGIDSITLWK